MSGTHPLETRAHLDSPLHRLPASLKLVLTLAFVAALATLPAGARGAVAVELAAIAMVAILSRVGRIPLATFAARLALAQPFVMGVALLALLEGRGLTLFVAIVLKSTACVAAVQLLGQTTRAQDLLEVLRRARAPHALVTALALLHRYLFVLADESLRMRRARAARTWSRSRWTAWRALASVIAVSFVRSVARAERISAAMRARGWS